MSAKDTLVNRLLQLAKKFNCFYLEGNDFIFYFQFCVKYII